MGSTTSTGTAPHTPRPRTRVGRHRPVVLLLAALLSLAAVVGLQWASAPRAVAATAATCTVSDANGCIQGTILDSDREPVRGAEVRVTGPGGFAETSMTEDDGRWSVRITTSGRYRVSLDQTTLPQGQYLADAQQDARPVQATVGSNAGTIFQLTTVKGATSASLDDGSGVTWGRTWQQLASGIRLGLLIALASVGLSLIYGTTGLSSFSHGEQVTLGGLLAYLFANVLGFDIWLAGIIVVVLCAATGYLQDAVIWRPLRRRRISLTQLMIVTIGLSIALQYAFQYFFGAATVRIQQGNPRTVDFAGVTLTVQSYVAMGIAVLVLVGTGLFLVRTRLGRATRAVSDNPALAAASGIDVDRVIRFVWTLAAGLAGLSGVMLGLVLNGVNWQTGLQLLLLMFAAVTLGGLGTAYGALVGSMVIGIVVELTNLVLPGDFKYATALVILILVLLLRPQGIFGRAERIG
ncbi:branched-chain amino acid ABC transporter permease [Curtobacterium sp. MCBD17_040]|uniref:branched-chain amino acid ABC transporter permease n=1 Tax=Curtobacterium sp. MCBD17_040 TaxID=2175674 RepID=UPI0021ACF85C|nr:branched-chain amino acid ABC transporter permease [Curtobacterium sp. MCBD17_040]WIB63951.1 branched-chain amino acid ABC transporter permease [Curtobacterium sp. MCBD17_040]